MIVESSHKPFIVVWPARLKHKHVGKGLLSSAYIGEMALLSQQCVGKLGIRFVEYVTVKFCINFNFQTIEFFVLPSFWHSIAFVEEELALNFF